MKLSEIVSQDCVISELSAHDKEGVLREMCQFLARRNAVRDSDSLYRELMEREKMCSTGIGENVGIPHARCRDADRLFCLFARSSQGVDFDSMDGKPVHFVCMLLAPGDSNGPHLKALAHISRVLKSQTLRSAIMKAKNEHEIYSSLVEVDSTFI